MSFWLEFIAEGVAWVLGDAATDALVQKISRRILWILLIIFILISIIVVIYYNTK